MNRGRAFKQRLYAGQAVSIRVCNLSNFLVHKAAQRAHWHTLFDCHACPTLSRQASQSTVICQLLNGPSIFSLILRIGCQSIVSRPSSFCRQISLIENSPTQSRSDFEREKKLRPCSGELVGQCSGCKKVNTSLIGALISMLFWITVIGEQNRRTEFKGFDRNGNGWLCQRVCIHYLVQALDDVLLAYRHRVVVKVATVRHDNVGCLVKRLR